MNIWIFNPYEPLPSEGSVRLRYGSLAKALVEQEHFVFWWSADWRHELKKRRLFQSEGESASESEPGSTQAGIGKLEIQIVSVPAYKKNISLRRVWSHWCYARGIEKQADAYAEANGKPDVILFSVPPMEVGRVALKLGKKFGARVVLDVMDAWPEALQFALRAPEVGSQRSEVGEPVIEGLGRHAGQFLATILCPLTSFLLWPYSRMMRRYCREADAICAQSRAFVEHARKYGAKGEIPVFHLAAHKPTNFDKLAIRNEELETPSLLRLVYLGSMGRVYDLETLVRAVSSQVSTEVELRLDFVGEGDQRDGLERLARELGVSDAIHFHGYLQGSLLDELMESADVGIIPMHPSSGVAIPYKAPHYLSYGLYVINSLPGEFMDLLEGSECGVYYEAGNPEHLGQVICELLREPGRVTRGHQRATELFESHFESDHVHSDYADWLTSLS